MRSIICLLFLCSFFAAAPTALHGQQKLRYSKASVGLSSQNTLRKLASLGVETDHGQLKPGHSFISAFSEKELERIKAAGFTVDILVPDVVADFQERNAKVMASIAQDQLVADFCNKTKTYKTPRNWKLGAMGGHLTYEQMLVHLDSMRAKFPHLVTAKAAIDTTKTREGRTIWFVKISDQPDINEPTEPQGLFSAVHHAREPVGMHQLIYFMWYLLENYNMIPELKNLVNNTALFFVPCLNPDGYIFNQTEEPLGGGMWRKNRRNNGNGTFGVDLNRNYGFKWGFDDFGSSPFPDEDTYRGDEAFSEPETRAMKHFCETHRFKAGLNYHTYSNLIIHPWGFNNLQCPDSTLFRNLAKEMAKENNYRIGTGMEVLGYNSNGSSDDFMYAEQDDKPAIMAMTPEVGDWFWPTADQILPLCAENVHQNLTVVRSLLPCAYVQDSTGLFLRSSPDSESVYRLLYKLTRSGVNTNPATFTITFTPFGDSAVGLPTLSKTYTDLLPNQTITDSVLVLAATSVEQLPRRFAFEVAIDNGIFITTDTVYHVGSKTDVLPQMVENCDNADAWLGSWVVRSGPQLEGNGCLSQSEGNYAPATNAYMQRKQPFDLRNRADTVITAAEMTMWTQFDIEKNFDYASVEFSADSGLTWAVACTDKSSLSSPFSQQAGADNIIPVWDGVRTKWAKERIDLQPYLGKKLWMRFFFHSDDFAEFAGFMVDDIRIRVAGPFTYTGVSAMQASAPGLSVFPNPAKTEVNFQAKGLGNGILANIQILNAVGNVVDSFRLSGQAVYPRQLRLAAGCYFVQMHTADGGFYVQKMLIE